MELEFFNQQTIPSARKGSADPVFRVTHKGPCYFNKGLMDLMELKIGDKVELTRSKGEGQWYIFKSTRAEAFEIGGNEEKQRFTFSSTGLARKILDTLKGDIKSFPCPVSAGSTTATVNGESITLFPVITVQP